MSHRSQFHTVGMCDILSAIKSEVGHTSRRKYCVASTLKGAACRRFWKTSLTAMSAKIGWLRFR